MKQSVGRAGFVFASIWIALLCIIIHFSVTSPVVRYESNRTGYLKIQDFHYYIVVIESFWFHKITSVYDPISQITALQDHFGMAMHHAMPLGISPTFLLIMLPFALVAKISFPLANTLWVSACLSVFGIAVLRTYSHLLEYRQEGLRSFIAVFTVFFFSFRTVTVIFLGQTSLLASGLLLFMLLELTVARNEGRPLRRWVIYPIIFLLSMKLHYLFLGIMLLLIGGYVYDLLASFVILGLSAGLLFGYSGSALLTGFLKQLSMFSTTELPEYYDISNIFHTSITFRGAFAPIIGESLSLGISLIILALGCLALVWIAFARHSGQINKRKYVVQATTPQLIIASFALLLLFIPHIGGYEDILACVPFASAFLSPSYVTKTGWKFILVILVLAVFLNQGVVASAGQLWIYWTMKASIFISLFFSEEINTSGELTPKRMQVRA